MRVPSLLLLLVALLLCGRALALSAGEEEALGAFLKNFIGLNAVQPNPWTPNISMACTPPVFYGLTCSEGPDPHVTQMYDANLENLPLRF